MWARDALAALSPRERARAGLLPLAVALTHEEEDEPPVERRRPRRATAVPVTEPVAREPVGIAASAGETMLLEDDPWPQ